MTARARDALPGALPAPSEDDVRSLPENVRGVFLTPREVGEQIQVSADTVKRMCRLGHLPGARKFGAHWRIPPGEVEAFFAEPRVAASTKRRKK